MNTIAQPRLITGIVILLAIPVTILFGTWAGAGDLKPFFGIFGICIVAFLMFSIPQWLWMLAVASLFVPGQIPALPLPFKPMEILIMLGLAKYLLDDVVFRKRKLLTGPAPDWYFVVGLLVIMLWHGFHDRFAMRAFGSDTWGGRTYVTMLVGFAAYFVVQSTSLKHRSFRMLPAVVVACGSVDFLINVISTALPDTSELLGLVYSNVSVESGMVFAGRWGFAGNFGYLLLFWSLSSCRIHEFLTKQRWLPASMFALGLLLCMVSGYRSTILIATMIVALAAFRDFGLAGALGLLPVGLLFSGIIFLHTMGVELPERIQRGFTFLPGMWDESAVEDSEGSNQFRREVWDEWMTSQFPKNPILGRGFGLNFEDMIATLPFIAEEGSIESSFSKYTRAEAFVISGNIHHGFYSVIDRFGLVGALFFVCWTVCVLRRMFREVLAARTGPMDPAVQWICLYVIVFAFGFPLGALKAENLLPNQLFLAGLFLALLKAREREAAPTALKRTRREPSPPAAATPAGYGRPMPVRVGR